MAQRTIGQAAMTTVPTWAAILVSIGTPVLTFAGVLIAQLFTRQSAAELETRSRREETMRNLRWAAALAVSEDAAQARLGIAQLKALGDSELLSPAQQLFVDAALEAAINDVADEVNESGDDAEVFELRPLRHPDVLSDYSGQEEGDDDE